MPEYVPQVQLPVGLAQELVRQMSNRPPDPLTTAIQGLASLPGKYFEGRTQFLQNNVSPEQAAYFSGAQKMPGVPFGQQAPAGYSGQSYQPNLRDIFPSGFNTSNLALLKEKVGAEAGMGKVMAVQGLKGQQANDKDQRDYLKTHTRATTDIIENLNAKKMNIGFKEGDLIPDSIIKSASGVDQKKDAATAKSGMADEKLWESINKATNPINAPRGSLLGQAGQGNARADRALTTLNGKNVTPQQVQAVVNDYAGIMQGGAPHETALRQMGYDNLATRWANMVSFLSSKPKAVNTPEVVGQLRQMITEIKQVDNQIIQNNLDTVEQTHSGLIAKDQKRWGKIREQITKGTANPGQQKKAPDARFAELLKSGLSKQQVYAKMHEEGY